MSVTKQLFTLHKWSQILTPSMNNVVYTRLYFGFFLA